MITHINPVGSMNLLSQVEVDHLKQSASGALYQLFRNCALAVLNSGTNTDDSKEIIDRYADFEINVIRRERGVKLELYNPPVHAFVDGEIIRGIQDHLFSVLRDIIYVHSKLENGRLLNLTSPLHLTDLVFSILRNANTVHPGVEPKLAVCWGGHSINRVEYQYTREVGNELGLREMNICTGCGPGAMEGPMKGAAVGHAKQRVSGSRYIGLTEPSIIASEPPNPIVNELVILPDIEKRLEAFVRMGHGIIVFPGGVGTAEEILYLLGIMMHPDNRQQPMPIIFTGPVESADYFRSMDEFIGNTLGPDAQSLYQIIIDDPAEVARRIKNAMPLVRDYRKSVGDAYSFNWSLTIDPEFQQPFIPNHESMAALNLNKDQPPQQLAANLRRAFSGIVAGNVKESGIKAIEQHGPFLLKGEPNIMAMMDKLLREFVEQQRMKLPGATYVPCYKITR